MCMVVVDEHDAFVFIALRMTRTPCRWLPWRNFQGPSSPSSTPNAHTGSCGFSNTWNMKTWVLISLIFSLCLFLYCHMLHLYHFCLSCPTWHWKLLWHSCYVAADATEDVDFDALSVESKKKKQESLAIFFPSLFFLTFCLFFLTLWC